MGASIALDLRNYHFLNETVSTSSSSAIIVTSVGSAVSGQAFGLQASSFHSLTKISASPLVGGRDTDLHVIQRVNYMGRTFKVRGCGFLELWPTYDETGRLLRIENEPLGIHVFAENREELFNELDEQICMLWDEYACESDDRLSPSAIHLKRKLLETFEEA